MDNNPSSIQQLGDNVNPPAQQEQIILREVRFNVNEDQVANKLREREAEQKLQEEGKLISE